ncbi:MAG TPA: insulinase family protein [Flavobacteriales bacterium]|nr:insulinase family protein [Flavobacteriales bacterium]
MNKKTLTIILVSILLALLIFNQTKEMKIENRYETAKNDPLDARIYTLDNGLKVYLSVYKDAPRIQTNIAIKAGSKDDPKDATGLAHYLEHMLFKGTDVYGSLDYEKEKPLLDKIEMLYEEYRSIAMTDTANRERVWNQIDSVSGEAAKFAIANEYDKMLSGIGAKGTNAYTSNEKTVYVNDIPSNQIEKWLKIEAERFRKPVLRLFHTELETVYEEKNRGLDNDGRKMFQALMAGLFQKHQYGTQTTIGTIAHLKNPSLVEINKFYTKNYVPNNMAICLSGDLDYNETIKLIDKYFGSFERKEDPSFEVAKEDEIQKPIIKDVYGPEAERLYIGFRFPGVDSEITNKLGLTDMILSNSTAGLIDLNLNQEQEIIGGGCFPYVLKDYSMHGFYGSPKQGQSLEEVKDLLLAEIEKVKSGDFPDWLIPAIINDFKLEQIKKYESNNGRAGQFVESFILDLPWEDFTNKINEMAKLTKQDIIDFANHYYSNNYVVVYKRQGIDESVLKVAKPKITPVDVNRTSESNFLTAIMDEEVNEIEPVFLDFETDIQKSNIGEVEILYKENTENDIFKLDYQIKKGTDENPKSKMAAEYLKYLGTRDISASKKQEEFYKIGAEMNVSCNAEEIKISLTGLNENFEESIALMEDVLANAVADEDALSNLKMDMLKKREDAKKNKQTILFRAMGAYARYGANSSFSNVLSDEEIENTTAVELIEIIHNLTKDEHIILYYGPSSTTELNVKLTNLHTNTKGLNTLSESNKFEELNIASNKVYVVDYDMKQAEVLFLAKGSKFKSSDVPIIRFHNSYFGGGMSSIIFQELRESKALAYSVYSTYTIPKDNKHSHYSFSYIGTQADKLEEAMNSMMALLQTMPEAESNMESAKEGVIQKIRTERLTKSKVLSEYQKAEKMGIDYDVRKDIYTEISDFTMEDLTNFHNNYIKNDNYTIMVLGNQKDLDLEVLKQYGEIVHLTLEDVFGY